MNHKNSKIRSEVALGEFWRDTLLPDFDDEEWCDVMGFDGIYQVSNLGRIKSLSRYTSQGRLLKEKIRCQGHNGNTLQIVFCVDGINTIHQVAQIVGRAFLRDKLPGEVYIHRNKIQTDNRKGNLFIGTRTESAIIDQKMGVASNNEDAIANFKAAEQAAYWQQFGIFDNGVLVAKICISCMAERPLSDFRKNNSNSIHLRRTCWHCVAIHAGVLNPGFVNQARDLANAGLRKCSKCEMVKPLDEFAKNVSNILGRRHTCVPCTRQASKEARDAKKHRKP